MRSISGSTFYDVTRGTTSPITCSTSHSTRCAAAHASKTSSYVGTTRSTSMRSGLRASRIQQRPGTSAGGSIATTSNNSPRRSTKRGFVSGVSSRMSSSKRQSSMPTGRSWRPAASARRGSASATRAYGGTSHCSFRWRTRTNRCSARIEAATDRRRKVLPVDSIRPSTWLTELGFEGSPLGGTQRSARP